MKKTGILIQILLISAMLVLIASIIFMVKKWSKGQESDYDPDEVTTEFDTDPTDYVYHNMQSKEDGRLTILTLGNSPFADNYSNNNLAKAIADTYDATVINGGIEDSYITCKNYEYNDEDEEDGVSLPSIAEALVSGDFSVPEKAAAQISEQAQAAVSTLKDVNLSEIDRIIIMYNLEDYRDHRPLGSESTTDVTSIYGAIYGSIDKIVKAYPQIRVIYLSQPAGGVTIDDFYVDGDVHDIGCGLLNDYVVFEREAAVASLASFIDIYYGVITVDQRAEYLADDYHINDAGAVAIAKRVHKVLDE